jgi:hypothetical protein
MFFFTIKTNKLNEKQNIPHRWNSSKIHETILGIRDKIDTPLTDIYMIDHFPGLVQAL